MTLYLFDKVEAIGLSYLAICPGQLNDGFVRDDVVRRPKAKRQLRYGQLKGQKAPLTEPVRA